MQLLEVIKLTIRILNPLSKSSIWSDTGFNNCGRCTIITITGIILIVIMVIIGNFIPPIFILFIRPDYNYTTGCDGNQIPEDGFGLCYNSTTAKVSDNRIRCNNINYKPDYIGCGMVGIGIAGVIIGVIVGIGIILYQTGLKTKDMFIYIKDAFTVAYDKSIKVEELEINVERSATPR